VTGGRRRCECAGEISCVVEKSGSELNQNGSEFNENGSEFCDACDDRGDLRRGHESRSQSKTRETVNYDLAGNFAI